MKKYYYEKIEIEITYDKSVFKFLTKHTHLIDEDILDNLILKGLKKLLGKDINIDIGKLHGKFEGKYRIRKGDLRVIFSMDNNIVYVILVEHIDFRGSVYN